MTAIGGKVPCVECGTDHHKKELKEEKCGDGMYYCKTSKKCKKIPKGHRVGKDGMLVKGVRWQDSDAMVSGTNQVMMSPKALCQNLLILRNIRLHKRNKR